MHDFDRRQEVLRQASVALDGRPVTLWRVAAGEGVVPEASSFSAARQPGAERGIAGALLQWGLSVIEGTRWVGCDANGVGWCVAPVRQGPAAPPPGGVERRSRTRMTLELAGLGLGAVLDPAADSTPAPAAAELQAHDLGVIVHEVANPLVTAGATLEGCIDAVREAVSLDPGQRGNLLAELEAVSEAVERAAQLLRAAQDRARGVLARYERFDAVRVVRSCIRLEEPLARRKGVELHLASEVPELYLHGDPNALFQILTNLIRNAVDASQVTRLPVDIDVSQSRHSVRLRVRDQGQGITREQLSRIFEPGYTTKGFGAGAGMGLTVVRDLAERVFSGSVEVESASGKGTTFTVLLPIPPQREANEEEPLDLEAR